MVIKLKIECRIVKVYPIFMIHKTDMKLIAWLSDSNDVTAKPMKDLLTANQYRDSWPALKVYVKSNYSKSIRLLLVRFKTLLILRDMRHVKLCLIVDKCIIFEFFFCSDTYLKNKNNNAQYTLFSSVQWVHLVA